MLVFLTCLYLLFPIILFCYFWLVFPLNIILVGMGVVIIFFLKKEIKKIHIRSILSFQNALLIGVSCILILLSGIGVSGFQNGDWFKHNAILNDLIKFNWPVYYQGIHKYLVYYVAYYLPAAFVGKLFGYVVAQYVLMVWTGIGVVLVLRWFLRLSGAKNIWIPIGIFLFFSGLDCIGFFLMNGKLPAGVDHIEWWNGRWQYSSNITLLFWVPQHAIAGWLLSSLTIDDWNHWNAKRIGLYFGLSILWSPFILLGLIPYWIIIWVKSKTFSEINLVNIFGLIFGIIGIVYLKSNRGILQALYFFWTKNDVYIDWPIFILFLSVEVIVYIYILFTFGKLEKKEKTLLYVASATLIILPFIHYGLFNDFVMRSSVPALIIIQILLIKHVSQSWKIKVRRSMYIVIFLLAAMTGLFEISRSVKNWNSKQPITSVVRMESEIQNQYVGEIKNKIFILPSLDKTDRKK